MTRLSIRIYFEPTRSALGPGMVELLERIAAEGSIRQAAAAMDMSYRKAWLLTQKLQKTFGGPVVTAAAGGVSGGGSQLTELGNKLLTGFRRIEVGATRAVQADLRVLTQLVKAGASPRQTPRKKSKK